MRTSLFTHAISTNAS